MSTRWWKTLAGPLLRSRQALAPPEPREPHPLPPLPVFPLDHPFGDHDADWPTRLGGKGASLVLMHQRLRLPVPPAFILGTALCPIVLDQGWPAGLDTLIDQQLDALESASGQRLGDARDPLLLSVRSGAPVSMPGMMDTILNLGANADTIAALARRSGSERFACDTWLRFCRMYAGTVLGLPAEQLGPVMGPAADTAALREAIRHLRQHCQDLGRPIPDDPREQLRGAIEAVFRSSRSERARVYREREGLTGDIPSAVVVQAMVFGNLGPHSGTGVAFTRNPSSGENQPYGDFLPDAQGEDVVAGQRITQPLARMAQHLPEAHRELLSALRRLERHYRDLCDVEFTVQAGRLHILQARVGKRSAAAAARIAVEMTDDPDIQLTRREALQRVTSEQWRQLEAGIRIAAGAPVQAQGVAAAPGVVCGRLCFDPDRVETLAREGEPVILIRESTSPHDVHGMVAAAGIVTATGGLVSHAALVARAWGIAAVCGVTDLVFGPVVTLAGQVLRETDRITLDGGSGRLYLGDWTEADQARVPALTILRRWAIQEGIDIAEVPRAERAHPDDSGSANSPGQPPDPLALMRCLGLAGFARVEKLAVMLGIPSEVVSQALAALEPGQVASGPRGWHLSSAGREHLQAALARERSSVARTDVEDLYQAFTARDADFKHLVTDWQLRRMNPTASGTDNADDDPEQTVQRRLNELDRAMAPVLARAIGLVPRLHPFRQRFDQALAAVNAGDSTMIASPLKDSYHTIWFELHEELIHLSGRDRAAEEAAAR